MEIKGRIPKIRAEGLGMYCCGYCERLYVGGPESSVSESETGPGLLHFGKRR